MNIKQIASIAIIAALPFAANAAQTIVTTNTPAAVGANGTVNRAATSGPYQTATIGEHDDEHIATTAYVKGAYNDAIAAVNKVDDDKQAKLINGQNNNNILPKVVTGSGFNGLGTALLTQLGTAHPDTVAGYAAATEEIAYDLTGVHNNAAALDDTLISAGTVMQWMREVGAGIDEKQDKLQPMDSNIEGVNYQVITASDAGDIGAYLPDMTLQEALQEAGYYDNDSAKLISIGGVIRMMHDMGAELKSDTDAVATSLSNKRVEIYTTWDTNDTTQVAFVTASAQH